MIINFDEKYSRPIGSQYAREQTKRDTFSIGCSFLTCLISQIATSNTTLNIILRGACYC